MPVGMQGDLSSPPRHGNLPKGQLYGSAGDGPSFPIFTLALRAFIRVNDVHPQPEMLQCDISTFFMLQCSYSEIPAR
jgi:hypothetical protein